MRIKFTQKLELGSSEDGVRCKHVCIFMRVHVCVCGVYVCSCVCVCECARARARVGAYTYIHLPGKIGAGAHYRSVRRNRVLAVLVHHLTFV